VTPQAVDTKELPALGADWKADNPYRAPPAQPKAVTIGSSAYNQNMRALPRIGGDLRRHRA
jgi:hypothetical protein